MILESILSNLLYQHLLPHLIDQEGMNQFRQRVQAASNSQNTTPEKDLKVERVEFPPLPASHIVEHQGSANAAALAWLWPTTDKVNAEHYAKLMLLEEVLSILLTEEVREKAGASYSPYPFSSNDFLPTGFGYLGLFSVTDTTQLKLVEESFDAVLSRVIADHGIDADMLQRAK